MRCGIEKTIIKSCIVMSCGYPGNLSKMQCKIQLCRDNLEEKKVLESEFFGLSESLKSKLFTPVATMVLPPEYTRFITNLSF